MKIAVLKLISLGLIILMTACNEQSSVAHVQAHLLIDDEFWSQMREEYSDSDLSDESILAMTEEMLSISTGVGSIFIESDLAELRNPMVKITREKHNSELVTLLAFHDGEFEVAFPSPLNGDSNIYYRKNSKAELVPVEVSNQAVIDICKSIVTQTASEGFSAYLKSIGEL